MKKLAAISLLLFLVACGPTGSPNATGKSAAKNGQPKKVAAKPKSEAAPSAPETKKFTVAADAYPGIPEAIAALILAAESAKDGDKAMHEERLNASGWLAMQKGQAVTPLAEKLADESIGLAGKIAICRTLGQVGPTAEATLTEALKSEDHLVRINAAEQLAIIRPTSETIVQTLIDLLDHEDPRLRERAVRSLAYIGPPAIDAQPRLQAILNSDADENLRGEARRALAKVNPRRTFKD